MPRLCDRCESKQAIPTERYCTACRKAVIRAIREAHRERFGPEQVVRRGAEQRGRHAIALNVVAMIDDMGIE